MHDNAAAHLLHLTIGAKDSRRSLKLNIVIWKSPDVASVVLRCFWQNLYCSCAETAASELPVKLLTSTLNSAILIS